jgi:hypothetical protein
MGEGSMGNESKSSERELTIARARSRSILDAAYLIADFNSRCRITQERPIDLAGEISSAIEAEALSVKVNALRADEVYFGEKHWTGRASDEIYEEMRQRHPGFALETYELALRRGILAMR